MEQCGMFCDHCQQQRLHARKEVIGCGFGTLLTILTGGLFLFVWIFLACFPEPWVCQTCGNQSTGKDRAPRG